MREYLPVLILLVIGVGSGVLTVVISKIFGPKRHQKLKYMPYECGLLPADSASARFSVKFYLVAVLFILFDIETVYLIPWAVIYKDALKGPEAGFMLATMCTFMAVLVLGLIYIIRKRALDWNR